VTANEKISQGYKKKEIRKQESYQERSYAQKLLSKYRNILWRKMTLESVSDIDTNAIKECKKKIHFVQELVRKLQNEKNLGNRLYWVIFVTYMTVNEPNNIDEILSIIEKEYEHIPRRTYFWLRGRAIEILDGYLTEMF